MTLDALPAVMGLIQQGALRGLAVTSATRSPDVPQVPTLVEQGLPDLVVTSWIGAFGPAGMSPAVVDQLSRAFLDAAAAPEGRARLRAIGATPLGENAATFNTAWRGELARWREVVRAANVPQED